MKKFTSALLLAAMMLFMLPAAHASTGQDSPEYLSFTGSVTTLETRSNGRYVFLKAADGNEAYFIIDDNTFLVDESKIKTGETLVAFYAANMPVLAIYPPQYAATLLAPAPSGGSAIFVGTFDSDFVSKDNFLKLLSPGNADIFYADGAKYTGGADALKGKTLAVVYGVVTLSIPGQTNPETIYILTRDGDAPSTPNAPANVSKLPYTVGGKKLKAPAAYVNANGAVMVPLRAIAKKLGMSYKWVKKEKTAYLSGAISLTIGKDYYVKARMTPIELGSAPEFKRNIVYVPLDFFSKVAGCSAEISSGRIVIQQ